MVSDTLASVLQENRTGLSFQRPCHRCSARIFAAACTRNPGNGSTTSPTCGWRWRRSSRRPETPGLRGRPGRVHTQVDAAVASTPNAWTAPGARWRGDARHRRCQRRHGGVVDHASGPAARAPHRGHDGGRDRVEHQRLRSRPRHHAGRFTGGLSEQQPVAAWALDRLEPEVLSGLGAPRGVFVSPDGQWVGFSMEPT